MLVSPLMGPILSGIFGAVINDKQLKKQGIKNECISLLIIILIGFILGLIFSPILKYGDTHEVFPTVEMVSRGVVLIQS